MELKEMVKNYPDKWLLIEMEKYDENGKVKSGKVLVHSHLEEEIYESLLKFKGRNLSIEYTGKIPDNLTVML